MNGNIVPHPSQAREWQKTKEAWMIAVASDQALNKAALRVAMILRDMFNAHSGDAWPSQATLAERTGLTDRSVRRGLDALVASGHLEKLARFGRNGTRRYAMSSTGQGCPNDEDVDRTRLSTSTGQGCPDRPDKVVRQTPEEPLIEPQITPRTSKTSSSSCVSPQGKTPKRTKTMETHGRRIRPSWQPSEQNLAFAAEHGFEGFAAQEAADEFKAHHLFKGEKAASWDRKWQFWIRTRGDLVTSQQAKPSGSEIAKNAAAISLARRLRQSR